MKQNNVKSRLFVTSVLAGLAMATPSFAQEAASGGDSDEIVVTGSRIARQDLVATVPIQTITAEQLRSTGATNVIDALRELPGVGLSTFSTTNSNFDVNNSGVNTINLRNLGDSRTLVLIDGRRMVAGVAGDSAVDFNSIPSDFIDRVEVITGGASAVYGSEAIAGVVNIITKSDFEGVEVRGQYGETSIGDNSNTQMSLTLGGEFADGKGNVIFNLNYNNQGAVYSAARGYSSLDNLRSATSGAVTRPQFSSFGATGRFFTCGDQLCDGGVTVNSAGAVVPWSTLNFGYNRNGQRLLAVPTQRYQFATKASFEITPDIEAFADAIYTKSHTESELEAFPLANDDIFGGDTTVGIPIDNPFVPTAIRDEAVANGATSIPFFRRQVEVANRGSVNDRDIYRFTAGVRGNFADEIGWELAYVRGVTQQSQLSSGQVNVLNYQFALDAVRDTSGAIVCRNVIAQSQGCVPINLFGAGAITPAAAAYLSAPAQRTATITQDVFTAALDGSLPIDFGAGKWQWAGGLEYREESSVTRNDALTRTGLNAGNAIPDIAGQFDVVEAYAEFRAPLVAGVPGVHELSLEAAGRVGKYSTVDDVASWKFGGEWAPIEGLRFRSVYAEANRAPNVGELFDPGSQDFPVVQDVCEGVTATSTRAQDALCRAIPGMAARIVADGGAFTPSQTEIQGVTGFDRGNPDLDAEKAKTLTLGLVFQPTFFEGFNFTIDYYKIEVEDAIDAVPRNYAITQCYITGNPVFCGTITRNARAVLDRVDQSLANIASLETEGYDITASYNTELDKFGLPGAAGIRVVWGHLSKNTLQALPDAPADDTAGFLGDPEDKVTTDINYSIGGLWVNWRARYIGESRLGTSTDPLNFPASSAGGYQFTSSTVDAWWYHDVQLRFDWKQAEFYVGLNNLLDEEPPLIGEGITGVDTGTATDATTYDIFGRSYYAGVRMKF